MPYTECAWQAATTSGRAAWIAEWMTNPARFTGLRPYHDVAAVGHEQQVRHPHVAELMPNGFTQK